jgi:hypothetical protein
MLDGALVIDAVAHSYDYRESNYASGRYSQAVTELIFGAHTALSPEGYRIPREHFIRDWDVEETANLLFVRATTTWRATTSCSSTPTVTAAAGSRRRSRRRSATPTGSSSTPASTRCRATPRSSRSSSRSRSWTRSG